MIPLLPYERRLAEILGVTQEEYQQWKAITLKHSIEKPAEGIVCGPLVPVLVNLAIAVGVSLLSSLLFPTNQQNGRIVVRQGKRDSRTTNQRLSPRFGFDSIQEPAEVGQFIPVIIAKRENGLGGVRVAMPMVWSQILAYNGSLMFRGIFLAGAARMGANAWDPAGWAFGNNTLGAYAYTGTALSKGARYSIYHSPAGGRIKSADLVAGREASGDPGNFENQGGQDVFAVNIGNSQYRTAFCMAETPSTSTAFGLYGWCPNAMMHRASITIQPTVTARISTSDKVRTDDDAAALVELWKGKFYWSMRGGLRQHKSASSSVWTTPASGDYEIKEWTVGIGDSLKYVLSSETDANTKIRINTTNSRVIDDDAEFEEKMGGVAAAVAGVQDSADSALIPNELYMIGTCWAVLEQRVSWNPNESVFVSDSEQDPVGGGNTMEYIFTVVRAGNVHFVGSRFLDPQETGQLILPDEYDPDTDFALMQSGTEGRYKVCSQVGQIFRLAVASVGAVREFQVCEIILKSKVGISVNGMIGFKSCEKIEKINGKAGQNQVGKTANGVLSVSRYDSGGSLITTKTRRYSAFALQYSADRGATWVDFPETYAIAGISGEDVYNYLRIAFPSLARWERRLVPVPSWYIRSSDLSRVVVLGTNSGYEVSTTSNGVTVTTTGYVIDPTDAGKRKIAQLEPALDIGLGWADPGLQSMVDGYARFAEAFPYESMQTTVGNTPEHTIQQVNYYADLNQTPSYEAISPVGVNISASLEISSLQSFSGFCDNGYEMPRLLNGDTKGSSHLWPDWLRELMTSEELGAFPGTKPAQIDRTSFQEAAQWCQDRQYFYDAVEGEPLTILEWASEIAQAHLLKLVRLGGVYFLKRAIEFNTPLEIKAQFNNGNLEDFRLNTVDYLTRQPFIVQVKWREESTGPEAPLFPRERVATVRQAGTSVNAPVRSLDLSKWCTNYRQAIDAACYYIRFVTLNDHQISFKTTPDVLAARLHSGGCFVLDVDVVNYSTAFQGFIQQDGNMVSVRPWLLPLADGTYTALTWDMSTNPREQTITIAGGLASPTGIFFAIRNSNIKPRTYEIKKVGMDAEGVVTVEAFHHPTDANGVSLLGVNWTTYQTDANWVIEL
jgi:hypothetical protein